MNDINTIVINKELFELNNENKTEKNKCHDSSYDYVPFIIF